MRTDVLGVGFDDVTAEEAARTGYSLMRAGGFHYVVTPNPEFLLNARKDARFRRVLEAAELVLRESLHALSRLPCTVELTVALHDTGADRQALERISILQQEYPFLTVVSDEGLKALLCATEPDATPLFHG